MIEVIVRVVAICIFRIPVALFRWMIGGFSKPFDSYLEDGHWRTEGVIGLIIIGLLIAIVNTFL